MGVLKFQHNLIGGRKEGHDGIEILKFEHNFQQFFSYVYILTIKLIGGEKVNSYNELIRDTPEVGIWM